MPTILISGANKGLGLGFARRFAADGWRVLASCRSPDAADDLVALADVSEGRVRIDSLDVLDHESIERYAETLSGEAVDILFNNAGIQGPQPQNFGDTDYEAWAAVMRTNVFGVMKMSEAFIAHVARSDRKMIVNVSSGTSSIANKTAITPSRSDKGELYLYRSSKTALNMVSRCMAWELQPRGVGVVMLGPGWVRTALGSDKARFSVEESVTNCTPLVQSWSIADTGKFYLYDGSEVPW
jgi:NAD(P)-dependent dehydrogenase (short-subunit alcohol dehydrogenase family)